MPTAEDCKCSSRKGAWPHRSCCGLQKLPTIIGFVQCAQLQLQVQQQTQGGARETLQETQVVLQGFCTCSSPSPPAVHLAKMLVLRRLPMQIAGAAAAEGLSLREVAAVAREAAQECRSVGMATHICTVPGAPPSHRQASCALLMLLLTSTSSRSAFV